MMSRTLRWTCVLLLTSLPALAQGWVYPPRGDGWEYPPPGETDLRDEKERGGPSLEDILRPPVWIDRDREDRECPRRESDCREDGPCTPMAPPWIDVFDVLSNMMGYRGQHGGLLDRPTGEYAGERTEAVAPGRQDDPIEDGPRTDDSSYEWRPTPRYEPRKARKGDGVWIGPMMKRLRDGVARGLRRRAGWNGRDNRPTAAAWEKFTGAIEGGRTPQEAADGLTREDRAALGADRDIVNGTLEGERQAATDAGRTAGARMAGDMQRALGWAK